MSFKSYHPVVSLVYFVIVIGFTCWFLHPVCLGVALFSSIAYSAMLKGSLKKRLMLMLPVVMITAVMNPLFNHRGVTILCYLPGGNPLTLESVVYGVAAAVMLVSVINWFSCFNEIMTGDKIIYLFGRFSPAVSLIFSMTLRLVPDFSDKLGRVINAQKCIGKDVSGGGVMLRIKNGLSVLSVMTSWALEGSVETADSMKARGYGTKKRTSFSIFRFTLRDGLVLAVMLAVAGLVVTGKMLGWMEGEYFPRMIWETDFRSVGLFLAYIIVCMMPIILEIKEVARWKRLEYRD